MPARRMNHDELKFEPDRRQETMHEYYLPESLGLVSGAKQAAAMELASEDEFDRIYSHLRSLDHKIAYDILKTPAYDWIGRVNPNYQYNYFVSRKDKHVDLEKFASVYENATASIDDHRQAG